MGAICVSPGIYGVSYLFLELIISLVSKCLFETWNFLESRFCFLILVHHHQVTGFLYRVVSGWGFGQLLFTHLKRFLEENAGRGRISFIQFYET